MDIFKEYNQEEMFEFLNDLRESGDTNMFGAAPYLVEEFNISKIDARKVLSDWMKQFGK